MAQLAENRYGKSRVRLVRVNRQAAIHEFEEWSVDVLLRGDFQSCFVEGDNSKILPTDTMKNTVYSLARKSSATCIEEFSEELIEYLLSHNPQVSSAEVSIDEKSWQHLNAGGKPHPTTFIQAASEVQTTRVIGKRGQDLQVESGLSDLVLMKTTGSAFEGYVHDPLTTHVSFAFAPVRFPAQVDSSISADNICVPSKQIRTAHLVRNGRMRPGSGAANLRDYPHHAQ